MGCCKQTNVEEAPRKTIPADDRAVGALGNEQDGPRKLKEGRAADERTSAGRDGCCCAPKNEA